MQLLILPFLFPLFLAGFVLERYTRDAAPVIPYADEDDWHRTWFAVMGPPLAGRRPTAEPRSLPRH